MPFAAQAQTCVPGTTPDWMVTSDQLAARVRPAECAGVEQSPPDFGWPSTGGSYQLTLTYPDGSTKSVSTNKNWVNWGEVLPAGTYSWRVTSNGTASRARQFTVAASATPFLVPAMSSVLSQLAAKPRPRGLPNATTLATMESQRSSAVSALLQDVKRRFRESLPGTSGGDGLAYSEAALRAAAAAVYSNQGSYYNDAIRRVMNLASWDPRGTTSYANDNVGSRSVSWALALGYDWLYPRLSSTQRSQILAALKVRVGDMYSGVMASIARYPRNSYDNQSLMVAAAIAALVAPDLAEATTWLNEALPLALNAINPWGGEEGGFSNSETQGFWDVGEQLLPWYVLRWSTGIDVAKKAWVKNWARYMAYFAPLGTPAQLFGDGLEMNITENRARFGKGYTYFAPTPLGRWYALTLTGEDQTRLEYLMAPPADFTTASYPTGTPNTALLPTIGQIAMHSDLANPARTSVYFKSSPPPYGAFNHSHADQNSFVVNAGGQRLAIESGYYDGYKTTHWYQWYHQTRAKNAITYDNGQGQIFYEQGGKMGYGALTRYASGTDYDIVTGDATQAYGGALTKAQRSLIYLRPNLILVYDNLASDYNRQWEWNIHALNQMSVISDQRISLSNNGQSLCVDMLAGPTMRFTQTNQFTANPSSGAPQWHGKFYNTALSTTAEFIALMRVGCTTTTASASKSNGVWTVQAGGKTVQISDSAITVSGSTSAADTTAPSVPTGLTATAASSSQINLSWNASTDNVAVTGYYVYLNDKPLTTTTSTSFSHTGLTAGTTYNYRVSAYDAVPNHSAWTNVVSATTPQSSTADTTAPSVPTGLTATVASSAQINLAWNASTDNVAVTGYYVYLNDKPLATTTSTSFSHTGLAAGTTYNYRVSAYDAVPNHSAWTAPVSATTPQTTTADTTAPSVPTGLTATAASSSQINLSWNASTDNVGVTGYYVYLNDQPLTTTTNRSFSHTGLSAGTTYNYRVSAYDAVPNHSAWTASASATTSGGSSGGVTQGNTGGLPVIPGASGFGINTKAGRGGTVYRVTNLNASGTGSLKACTDASGPRVCVFEVSGTIYTTSDLVIRNPYITIAGQTAPSPGILIRGAGMLINTHDILIQHIRVRPGDATTGPAPINRDAFKIEAYLADTYNVVIDHVSGSWSTDELISVWGSSSGKIYDVTIRNSIFSEALNNSISPDGPHPAGPIIGYRASRIMLANSLMAFNGWRNPLVRDDSTDVMIINNMLYRTRGYTIDQIDFGTKGAGDVPMRASVQGNHFVLAPGMSPINTISINSGSASSFKIFVTDNTGPWMTSDPWSVVATSRSKSTINVATPPVWSSGVVPMPSSSVENYVLSYAGARPLDRDPVDARVVSQVRTRTGAIIDSPSQVGGYPNLPVNYRALTLPADPNTITSSGYTNLELWLQSMARALEGL
ncbi:MAG: heparinase II/III family protein [Betaproteobacteria bacterium]|nr:heparinase II/III family protein [Betaproteobacteria bacterium]